MRSTGYSARRAAWIVAGLVSAALAWHCRDEPVGKSVALPLPPRATMPVAIPMPARAAARDAASPFGPPSAQALHAPKSPEVDMCGLGQAAPGGDSPDLNSLPQEMRSAALAAAHEQLQLSGDEAVRAAGLLVAGQTESLARLAAGSADPVTYAIGLQACMDKSTTQAPACALLGRAQWARLDPDNAWPWLELAADARERGDAEGETRAMSRAAQASHLDEISGRLPGLIDKGMGELPGLPRTLVLQASWQRQSVWHSLAALQADRYCSTGVLMQGGGRPQCDALARTLVTNSTRIEHLAAGAALGARLGWPAPRLEGLRQEADALAEAA